MDKQKLRIHIDTLNKRHHALEQKINELIHTHGPEDEINRLKKEKLRIKDEIGNCERKFGT